MLEVIPNMHEEMHLSGIPVEGDPEKNLCWSAYKMIQKRHGIPSTYMHLMKLIPMGAGLGGGSSDAAQVLKALNDLYNLGLSNKTLEEYAAELGSDCPFFIEEVPQIARGRGEILGPIKLDLNGYFIKIINPGIHVGTAEAYAGVVPDNNVPAVEDVINQPIETWKSDLINDFEYSVFKKYPEIAGIKEKLYTEGAVYAAMSGSGSTVFGIYAKKPTFTFDAYFERILQL